MSYLVINNPGDSFAPGVALTTTGWTKILPSTNPNRSGFFFTNPVGSATNIFVLILAKGTAIGSNFGTFTKSQAKYQAVVPGGIVDDFANQGNDIWACADSAAVTVYPQEYI